MKQWEADAVGSTKGHNHNFMAASLISSVTHTCSLKLQHQSICVTLCLARHSKKKVSKYNSVRQ